MLDQLLFTWAPRGPNGPGLQAVAATARLADPSSTLTETARRYCIYVRPPGQRRDLSGPVSFGWADHGGDRFVFRRGSVDSGASGRPGNFYAHILVGPIAILPVAKLAQWFDSPFWWRGEAVTDYLRKRGGRLAPVSPSELTPSRLARIDGDAMEGFTDVVLGTLGRFPLMLKHQPATHMALIHAFDLRLPGVLEPFSVSTYETADAASSYHLVGMVGGPAAVETQHVSDQVRRVRRTILSEDEQDCYVRKIALAAARPDTCSSLSHVVDLLDVLGQALTGQPIDSALLPPALAEPSAAAALLSLNTGRAALRQALVSCELPVWEALAASIEQLPTAPLATVAAGVGGALAERGNRGAVADVLARCAAMPDTFTSPLVEALLTAAEPVPHVLTGLDIGLTLDLLDRRSRWDTSIDPVVSALLDTTPKGCLSIADATRLPVTWRAQALANRLIAVAGDPGPVIVRIDRCPELTESFVRALPDLGYLREALHDSEVGPAARVALNAARALSENHAFRQLHAVILRLAVHDRPAFLAKVLDSGRSAPIWGNVAATVVRDVIADRLRHRQGYRGADPVLLRILWLAGGKLCRSWLQILDVTTDVDRAVVELRHLEDGLHHRTAATLLLVRLLSQSPTNGAVDNVIRRLRNQQLTNEEIALLLMQACLSCLVGRPSPLPFLLAVMEQVENGRLKLSLTRKQLKNQDLQRTVQRVVAELGSSDRAKVRDRARRLGHAARRWWKTVS